jgi:hypothetical protein
VVITYTDRGKVRRSQGQFLGWVRRPNGRVYAAVKHPTINRDILRDSISAESLAALPPLPDPVPKNVVIK